jgi:hypothetical protein
MEAGCQVDRETSKYAGGRNEASKVSTASNRGGSNLVETAEPAHSGGTMTLSHKQESTVQSCLEPEAHHCWLFAGFFTSFVNLH